MHKKKEKIIAIPAISKEEVTATNKKHATNLNFGRKVKKLIPLKGLGSAYRKLQKVHIAVPMKSRSRFFGKEKTKPTYAGPIVTGLWMGVQ